MGPGDIVGVEHNITNYVFDVKSFFKLALKASDGRISPRRDQCVRQRLILRVNGTGLGIVIGAQVKLCVPPITDTRLGRLPNRNGAGLFFPPHFYSVWG